MRLDTNFAERLRWAIQHRNSNQSELARAIGISVQSVQQWASGATASPNLKHLNAACQFLNVRYEWLAFARGPMVDTPATPPDPTRTATAHLAIEWEAQFAACLPPTGEHQARLSHDGRVYRIDWVSDAVVAQCGLYSNTASLVHNARSKLWMLAIARALLPPVGGRTFVLILAPLSDSEPADRHYDLLRAEARLLHIDVALVQTAEQAASVCAGTHTPVVPEELLLGIDDSPIL
jgi:transcriptional regulator with XRE-family HTH domain